MIMRTLIALSATLQFDYKVHGFEDLRLNLNLGIDWAKSNGILGTCKGI